MKKKFLHLILAVAMLLALLAFACVCSYAASQTANSCADALYELGLFSGTGKNVDGTPKYDLDRAPSRVEAITMLVRLLGKEKEARAKDWTIPFDDVDEWAKPYVGYAYNNGLTAGVSATKFDSNSKASEAQYITFILRALGYSDTNGDFAWDSSKTLSNKLGVTQGSTNNNFLRADVVEVSYFALKTPVKNSKDRLIDVLYANHAVSTTEMANVERTNTNTDATKISLPGAINGISSKDLARACGCDENLYYIVNPKTEADHINNVKYVVLTGQWKYKKADNSSAARTSWGNCARTAAGKMAVFGQLQPQLFGAFQNYWCEFYYEDGGYLLYCSLDPVLGPKDIQTHLVEGYKIIDAKHNEFTKAGKFNANSSKYQIAKAYADWLTAFSKETKEKDTSFPDAAKTETAYGYLGLRKANCMGRAAAVAMSWSYEGIPAYGIRCGHAAGSWEGHILPWTVIDGQEYACESWNQPGMCKVSSTGEALGAKDFLSPYCIAMARKDMGLSYDKTYDYTNPNILSVAPKCQAVAKDIPFTAEYLNTNAAGEETYLVKIDASYNEASAKEYGIYLTTSINAGIKAVSNYYSLEKMKAGITIRISKETRLDALITGMDKLMIRVK